MQPTSRQILQAVRRTLRERIEPIVASSAEAAVLAPLDVALAELIAREGRDREAEAAARSALVRRGEVLLGDETGQGQDDAGRLQAMVIEAQRRLAVEVDSAVRGAIGAWTTDVIQSQYAMGLPVEEQEVDAIADDPDIDQGILAAAISRNMASGEAVAIDRLSVLSGGYSRDTFLVDWSAGQQSGELVLRRQKSQGMLDGAGVGLDGEFPLLRFAHDVGLPVPQVYWLENAPGSGGPYIAMEKASGSVIGTAIDAASVSDEVVRSVATTIARLHRANWRSAGQDMAAIFGLQAEGLTTRIATERLLDRWERVWAARGLDPSPALAAAFQWLRQNVPATGGEPCLLHGDIGFHNILFDRDDVAALLDWEMAYLGDPAKDMATCEAFISRYGRWEDFVRYYHEAGGPAFDEAAKRYYHVLRIFTHLLVGEMGWQTCFAHLERPKIEAMFLGGPIRMHFFADYLTYLPLIAGEDRIS
ncbi:Predicted kinase, aminoglycoside phosphotransferase (APT) family [Sphingobium faniae]|nr:Predicted kinase, aminoglycoside phosphotransferase (APT) family [Sphingobium faniae]